MKDRIYVGSITAEITTEYGNHIQRTITTAIFQDEKRSALVTGYGMDTFEAVVDLYRRYDDEQRAEHE